jgi:hypothetical protein
LTDAEPDADITRKLGGSLLESRFAGFHRQSVGALTRRAAFPFMASALALA